MAQESLRAAAEAAARHPDRAWELGIDEEETASWRDAAEAMYVPYDEAIGFHPQSDGFTGRQVWNFAGTAPDQYPLLLHFPTLTSTASSWSSKLTWCWPCSCVRAHSRTSRRRAISPITSGSQSGIRRFRPAARPSLPAEVGHLRLAHDYLGEAAPMDLDDLEHNTSDGLHIASLAGTWIALVAGFGGLRHSGGVLCLAASLPEGLTRPAFTLHPGGRTLRVEVTGTAASYSLADGEPIQIVHHGTPVTVLPGEPLGCGFAT
jgi:alpha,alpha-trehalose phosphorylase